MAEYEDARNGLLYLAEHESDEDQEYVAELVDAFEAAVRLDQRRKDTAAIRDLAQYETVALVEVGLKDAADLIDPDKEK